MLADIVKCSFEATPNGKKAMTDGVQEVAGNHVFTYQNNHTAPGFEVYCGFNLLITVTNLGCM